MRAVAAQLVAVAVLLLIPQSSEAILVYQRPAPDDYHLGYIVAARNDGSDARVIGRGGGQQLSPNGHRVAYFKGYDLYVVGNRGQHRRLVAHGVWDPSATRNAWSRGGRYLVAGEASGGKAVLVDVDHATSVRLPLDNEYTDSTFAPDGKRYAVCASFYSSSGGVAYLNVFHVGSTQARRLGEGCDPVWNRSGMAFSRGRKVLFRERIGEDAETLLHGPGDVRPIASSADGQTLLIERPYSTRDPRAVLVNTQTRAVADVDAHFSSVTDLSRDGREILGVVGDDVVMSTPEGATKVLATDAHGPSWTK